MCFHKKLTLNMKHRKCLREKAGMILLILDQADFKPRSMIRYKKDIFIIMKEHTWQKWENPCGLNNKETACK